MKMDKSGFMSDSGIFFAHAMIEYMHKEHGIDRGTGARITFKYIKEIDIEDATAQHLGPDYFALQIMMAEGLIPYKPM
jgi:outer membrane receptor for ferric coprogen and ferric-rhodotorulic acid